jgi:hypothetical protein
VLSGTTWFPASFNTQYGNDDEYQASFTAPEQGNYIYTARFSLDGVNWTYCDSNGAGSNPGHEYSNQDLTYMLVTVPVGAPGEPRSLTATGGNQQVNLSWMAPTKPGFSPITGYQAQVATSSGGPFINAPGCTIDGTTTNCIATGLTNGTTFFFRVAAKNDYGFGEYSNRPSATPSALFFSDDPIAQGISIKVAHVLELRNAITFTRQTFGLLASGYTDTLVAGSTPIKAVHITELRLALRDVYMQRGMVPPTYTDPVLTTSTPIKAVHINQIRAAILAAQ